MVPNHPGKHIEIRDGLSPAATIAVSRKVREHAREVAKEARQLRAEAAQLLATNADRLRAFIESRHPDELRRARPRGETRAP